MLWYILSVVFSLLKDCITAKWCNFLNLPECFTRSFVFTLFAIVSTLLRFLVRNLSVLVFWENNDSHPYSIVATLISKFCWKILWYLILLSSPNTHIMLLRRFQTIVVNIYFIAIWTKNIENYFKAILPYFNTKLLKIFIFYNVIDTMKKHWMHEIYLFKFKAKYSNDRVWQWDTASSKKIWHR